MSIKPAWSTERVTRQPGLHRHTLSKKKLKVSYLVSEKVEKKVLIILMFK